MYYICDLFYCHDMLFKSIVFNNRFVFYSCLIGIDRMNGVIEETCDAFAVGDLIDSK